MVPLRISCCDCCSLFSVFILNLAQKIWIKEFPVAWILMFFHIEPWLFATCFMDTFQDYMVWNRILMMLRSSWMNHCWMSSLMAVTSVLVLRKTRERKQQIWMKILCILLERLVLFFGFESLFSPMILQGLTIIMTGKFPHTMWALILPWHQAKMTVIKEILTVQIYVQVTRSVWR